MEVQLILLFAFGVSCFETHGLFKLDDCDPNSSVTLNITKFPSPLRLRNNQSFYLSASINVREMLPKEIKLEISLARKIGFWIRIPCLGCDQFLTCKEIPQLCTFRNMCKNCNMAISDIKITLPANLEDMIPGYIPGFVIEGYYWLRVRAIDPSNVSRKIACLELYLPLDDDKKK